MNKEKVLPIAKGIIKHIPGVKFILPIKTGGSGESRYCYAVWMRHLKYYHYYSGNIPETVAELGPGDSFGTGLAALLSGSRFLYALDVMRYCNCEKNLSILEEIKELYQNKTPIPDDNEFPGIGPKLKDYSFPSQIISDKLLEESLSEQRLNRIREEIMCPGTLQKKIFRCVIPWYDARAIENESVDLIFSQAVLQHVENLDNTYHAMSKWMKKGGLMSHTIDFKSIGITKTWNAHWTFNDLEWNIVKGGRIYLINRQPCSKHLELHEKNNFRIIEKILVKKENLLSHKNITGKFRFLSEEDLTTSGAYLLSKKY